MSDDRLLINEVAKFIGETNRERLQDGITDLILEQINYDFADYDVYLLDPDELQDMVDKCRDEAFNRVKSELTNKFEQDFREKMGLIC